MEHSSESAIEVVIFDLGKVILRFDHMEICRRLAEVGEVTTEDVFDFIFGSPLVDLFDEGRMSSRQFYQRVRNGLRLRSNFEDFRRRCSDVFEEDKVVSGLIRALKGRHRLYLLSNTNEMHYEFIETHFGILREFDEIMLSFRLGVCKPDWKIFRLVLEKSGAKPGQHFFIDDNQRNVEAALAMGMQAVRFESGEQLREVLRNAGLLTEWDLPR